MRTKLVIALLTLQTTLLSAPPTIAGASTLPGFIAPVIDYNPSPWQPIIQPTEIDLSTGHIATFAAGHWTQYEGPSKLIWRRWNGREAVTQAVFFAGQGNGPISAYPCKVTLSAPQRVHGHRVFTRWTIVFRHKLSPKWSGLWNGRRTVRWHHRTVLQLATYRGGPEYK